MVGQELESTMPNGQLAGRSRNRALSYWAEGLHAMSGGLLAIGGETSRLSGERDVEFSQPAMAGAFHGSWSTTAAYASFARPSVAGLWFEGGARLSASTLVHRRALAPWIRGSWRFNSSWTITASAGASRQFPELDAVLGPAGSSNLRPERAALVDVSIEQRLPRLRWQAALFNRREQDVLRPPGLQWQLFDDGVRDYSSPCASDSSCVLDCWSVDSLHRLPHNNRVPTRPFAGG